MVAEYDAAGNLAERYLHGGDAAADDPLIRYHGPSLAGPTYLFADHQGSIVGLSNASGAVTAINRYDEYGIPAPSNTGRFQYTGQIWLPELGMYHYKARVYSPTLGRFLQTDPIGYDGGISLYAYVGNDPLNHTDPTGTCAGPLIVPCVIAVKDLVVPTLVIVTGALMMSDNSGRRDIPASDRRVTQGDNGPENSNRPVAAANPERRTTRGGETSGTREGRRAHDVYGERARREGLRTGEDARLPSRRQPDAIDDRSRIVRELKPDTPSGRASGIRQVERYRQELEEITGEIWQGVVDLYVPRPH